jgi:hypothetical protein
MKIRLKHKILRRVRWGFFGLCVCGISAGLYFIDHPILAFRAEAAQWRWDDAGLPWTKDFFEREVKDDENAAILISQSAAAAQGFKFDATYAIKKANDAGQKYRAIYLMAGFKESLDLLIRASQKEHLYCVGDLDIGEELVLPGHNDLQRGARLLIERATLDSSRSFDDRLEDFRAVYRLAKLVKDEGYGCGPNHYRTLNEKLFLGVETLINSFDLSSDELEKIQQMTNEWSFEMDFGDIVPMMAYQTLVYLRNCPGLVWDEVNLPICVLTSEGGYTPRGEWKNDVHEGVPEGIEKRGLFVRASDYYVALKHAATLHHGDLLAQGAAFDEAWEEYIGYQPQISRRTLSYLSADGYTEFAANMVETKFLLDALRLAISVRREMNKFGSEPVSELVRQRISDPFTNSGAVVRIKEGYISIYALGQARKDLGGPDHTKSYPQGNSGIRLKIK